MENEISKINSTVQVVCRIYKMIPKKYMAKLQTSIFSNGKKKITCARTWIFVFIQLVNST